MEGSKVTTSDMPVPHEQKEYPHNSVTKDEGGQGEKPTRTVRGPMPENKD